jgi:hypothetical protein
MVSKFAYKCNLYRYIERCGKDGPCSNIQEESNAYNTNMACDTLRPARVYVRVARRNFKDQLAFTTLRAAMSRADRRVVGLYKLTVSSKRLVSSLEPYI